MSDTHTYTNAPRTDDATNAQADTSSNTVRVYEALFSRNNVSAATRPHALTRRNFLGATLAGLSVVSLGTLAGCAGNKPAPSKEPEKKAADPKKTTWEFTDQIDQKVSVQIPVERMVVLQHHSIDILAQLGAQKKVIAVEKNWEKDLGGYIKDVWEFLCALYRCAPKASSKKRKIRAYQTPMLRTRTAANGLLKRLVNLQEPATRQTCYGNSARKVAIK